MLLVTYLFIKDNKCPWEAYFSVTSLHQLFLGCLTLGFWLKLIFLRNSNTLLKSLCLKVLLCTNKWSMKLYPSIAISAMFLVILTSSAPKLLLLPQLFPALHPRLRQFKQLKGMFLVDWVLVLLYSPLLLCLSCKTSPKTRTYQLLKGMSGLQLILLLLMTGLQWYLDANPVSMIRGRQ